MARQPALKMIINTIAFDAYIARQLADDTAIVDHYEKTLVDIGKIIDQQNLYTKENKMSCNFHVNCDCPCEQCTYEPPKSIIEIHRDVLDSITEDLDDMTTEEKLDFLMIIGKNL